jgi:hypothetical protein
MQDCVKVCACTFADSARGAPYVHTRTHTRTHLRHAHRCGFSVQAGKGDWAVRDDANVVLLLHPSHEIVLWVHHVDVDFVGERSIGALAVGGDQRQEALEVMLIKVGNADRASKACVADGQHVAPCLANVPACRSTA